MPPHHQLYADRSHMSPRKDLQLYRSQLPSAAATAGADLFHGMFSALEDPSKPRKNSWKMPRCPKFSPETVMEEVHGRVGSS